MLTEIFQMDTGEGTNSLGTSTSALQTLFVLSRGPHSHADLWEL